MYRLKDDRGGLKSTAFHDLKNATIDDALQQLDTSKEGLTDEEAQKRLETYGLNEVQSREVNPLLKFLSYFWGPIPWMIEVAVIMSAVIGRWEDFFIILTLLMVNAVVGFWQEYKADNAVKMLQRRLASMAKVKRNGDWKDVPSVMLVPGDVVRVRIGDIVPADIKVMEGEYLLLDESALTGESLPVEKKVPDLAYSSSIVRQGEVDALVIGTGSKTFFGRTTVLVEKAITRSVFQKSVARIGNRLIQLTILMVTIVLIFSVLRGESLLQTVQFALVLTVAAIPAAMPAVMSVTMAIGAVDLSRKEAIVRKLETIEEMAGMDVLCSDKTGTITKNLLTVREVRALNGLQPGDVLLYGKLASRKEDEDPIDSAILDYNFEGEKDQSEYDVESFTPFDPVSKRTEAMLKDSQGRFLKVSKGAPQVILALSSTGDDLKQLVESIVDEFALKGYRALGVASNSGGEWLFAGLIALYDPPRADSAETIRRAEAMGVAIKLVTGDHLAIAKETAVQVGLKPDIVTTSAIESKTDEEAERIVENSSGFAEVFPEHKYRIVELLQNDNHIVGMTGDGVNDAPALKKADVGVAVEGSTDAAKSAAEIVLTAPGLSVIIDAINESRLIFTRITNYVIYRLTETTRVLIFITLSIVVFNQYPVTALMVVLLALLNDLPIMTMAYDKVIPPDRPEKLNVRGILLLTLVLGVAGVLSSFTLLYIGREVLQLSTEVLQSFIYLKLSVAGHLTVFIARTRGHFWSVRPAPILLAAVITTQLVATLITVYGFLLPAMGWSLALLVWGYAFVSFILIDYVKIAVIKRTHMR